MPCRSITCLSLWLQQIIDLLTSDKSRYFAQPRPMIVKYCITMTRQYLSSCSCLDVENQTNQWKSATKTFCWECHELPWDFGQDEKGRNGNCEFARTPPSYQNIIYLILGYFVIFVFKSKRYQKRKVKDLLNFLANILLSKPI